MTRYVCARQSAAERTDEPAQRSIPEKQVASTHPVLPRLAHPPTHQIAPFFGYLGAASAIIFSCFGAAYGTAKSGVGIAAMGVMRPELVMKSIIPVIFAGVLGIYGLIIAVVISSGINQTAEKAYYYFDGYAHFASGIACGFAALGAGMCIGIVGDAGVRANAQQPKLYVGMILILIFAEALALYGLIVGVILASKAGTAEPK